MNTFDLDPSSTDLWGTPLAPTYGAVLTHDLRTAVMARACPVHCEVCLKSNRALVLLDRDGSLSEREIEVPGIMPRETKRATGGTVRMGIVVAQYAGAGR